MDGCLAFLVPVKRCVGIRMIGARGLSMCAQLRDASPSSHYPQSYGTVERMLFWDLSQQHRRSEHTAVPVEPLQTSAIIYLAAPCMRHSDRPPFDGPCCAHRPAVSSQVASVCKGPSFADAISGTHVGVGIVVTFAHAVARSHVCPCCMQGCRDYTLLDPLCAYHMQWALTQGLPNLSLVVICMRVPCNALPGCVDQNLPVGIVLQWRAADCSCCNIELFVSICCPASKTNSCCL